MDDACSDAANASKKIHVLNIQRNIKLPSIIIVQEQSSDAHTKTRTTPWVDTLTNN